MSDVVEQTGSDVIAPDAGVDPPHPNFPVPYADRDLACRDAGWFSRRYDRPVHVIEHARKYWLSF